MKGENINKISNIWPGRRDCLLDKKCQRYGNLKYILVVIMYTQNSLPRTSKKVSNYFTQAKTNIKKNYRNLKFQEQSLAD